VLRRLGLGFWGGGPGRGFDDMYDFMRALFGSDDLGVFICSADL
jgi:hypothetical protein